MEKEWSQAKVLELIELYRERSNLWDARDPKYKNKIKRHDAFGEIAALLEESSDEVERKMKNLLSHFSRELKKEQQTMKSGAGSEDIYRSKWFAFESMSFLRNRNKPRTTPNKEENIITTIDKEVLQPQIIESECGNPGNSQETQSRKRKVADKADAAFDLLQKLCNKNIDKDEFSVYGEYVAIQVRNLKNECARRKLQHAINNAIFSAQMEEYNAARHTQAAKAKPVKTRLKAVVHEASRPRRVS
nr:uncharacterized protein LOC117228625 [Megalopta genalis]XP_033340364.1 uncharacterized protein LOC117228625 [Megalopta genalis]